MRLTLLLLVLFFSSLHLTGQDVTIEEDTSKASIVVVDFAEKQKYLRQGDTEVLILTGNVLLHQDSLFMECDSAHKEGNWLYAVGDVLLQQYDSLNVFADTLIYDGDAQHAELSGGVVLQSHAQKLFTEKLFYEVDTKIATYEDGAKLTNDTVHLFSKRGIYFVEDKQVFFKDSVYVQGEDFDLFADTLKYDTESKIAYFSGPTRINHNNGSKIYCENGYYDLANNFAVFANNAQYVKEVQQAQSDSIFFDGKLKQVTLRGNARLQEPGKKGKAREIIYNDSTEIMTLIGEAHFQDSTREVESDLLVYDLANDQFSTTQRARINNPPQFLEADTIDFDNDAGIGKIRGNIIWSDTSSNYTIYAEKANFIDSASYIKAYGNRPLFVSVADQDSFFLSADTLLSFEKTENQVDTIRQFLAFHRVKIYKTDLQAICDSLSYSSIDSMFRLYQDPVIWSDTSQFSADSIQILMVENQIERLFLKKNAFIINSTDEILFNQMKGKDIIAYFLDGEVHKMAINGNAESIYYAQDEEKAYIGVNETLCSRMLIKFGNNEVTDIIFYDAPKATFHPIQKTNPSTLNLEGFYWDTKKRPDSVKDIIAN